MKSFFETKDERVKIFKEDCIKFLESLDNNSVDIVVTDPAYSGMNQKMKFGKGRIVGEYKNGNGDKWFQEFHDTDKNYRKFLSECKRVIKEGKILNEGTFLEFLFGLFLYYFSYERYKFFFDKFAGSMVTMITKGKRVAFSPPPCPFRFVGIEDKTIFIGEMGQAHLFFKETLMPNIFNSYAIITHGKLILDKDGDSTYWKKHQCQNFCEQCKKDFSIFASNNIEKLCKGMSINGYSVLNISANLFNELISQDEFIEATQQPVCSCNERLMVYTKHCQNCGRSVDKTLFNQENKPGNPEKIFNEALGLYLSLKKEYNFKVNHTADDFFNEETDIFLFKESKVKIIEGTVKMKLDENYVVGKTKTLVLIEKLLAKEKKNLECDVLIWGINNPSDIDNLESIPTRIFPDKKRIFIIPSKINLEENNKLEINFKDLENIRKGFQNIIEGILANI